MQDRKLADFFDDSDGQELRIHTDQHLSEARRSG